MTTLLHRKVPINAIGTFLVFYIKVFHNTYMMRIISAFTLLFFFWIAFIQCGKKDTSPKPELTDTVVAGDVYVYDVYGQLVTPTPYVSVSAFQVDSSRNVIVDIQTTTDNNGRFVFSNLNTGIYFLRYSLEGYGEYILNNVSFDSLAPLKVVDVDMTTFAVGSAQLLQIGYDQSNSGILEFDRELIFGDGANAPYYLKTRYLFSLDSVISQENCFYTFVSGATEGTNSFVDRKTIKFALSNLKTFVPDSTNVFVSVAVETVPSVSYMFIDSVFYPNVSFPLTHSKAFLYRIPGLETQLSGS